MTGVVIFQLLGGPYLTGYLIHLGANAAQIGIVLAIPMLANLVQLVSASLMQKINSRLKYMVMGLGIHRGIWVLSGIIPFVLPKEAWVVTYIIMFLTSFIAAAASTVIWSSLISDVVPARVRGRFFGIRNTIAFGTGAVSLVVGGWILERYTEELGFAVIYGICAILTVINNIQLALHPDPPFVKSVTASDSAFFFKPLKDRMFFGATAFLAVWVLVQNLVMPLFPYVMLDVMHMSYFPHITVVTTVQNFVMMASFYLWGVWNSRIATQKLLILTLPILALSCVAWGLSAWMPAFGMLIFVHVLLGFGAGGFHLLVFNFIIGDTPKSERPMYVAVFHALTGLAGFIGPVVGGQIYGGLKSWPLWTQVYGFNVLVGIVLLVLALLVAPRYLKGGGVGSSRLGR
jgi:MFS family permease